MRRAVVFGLALLALGLQMRYAMAQEITAREADGQRPATLHEIRSLLQDLAAFSGELEDTQSAFAPGDLFCRQDRPYSPPEVATMIRCATRRFGGDASKIIAMGACESGLEPDEDGNLPYRGVFQYHPSTWDSAADRYWRAGWGRRHVEVPGIYNGRAQVIVTVRYVVANGYGPWAMGACA